MPCGTTTIPTVNPAIMSPDSHPKSTAKNSQEANSEAGIVRTVAGQPLNDREEAEKVGLNLKSN